MPSANSGASARGDRMRGGVAERDEAGDDVACDVMSDSGAQHSAASGRDGIVGAPAEEAAAAATEALVGAPTAAGAARCDGGPAAARCDGGPVLLPFLRALPAAPAAMAAPWDEGGSAAAPAACSEDGFLGAGLLPVAILLEGEAAAALERELEAACGARPLVLAAPAAAGADGEDDGRGWLFSRRCCCSCLRG